jgi:hypothetical protein
MRIENIKSQIRAYAPENVVLDGYKIYSQNDEDGIIAALFRKIPLSTERGCFIEIGCGNGLQNNTHALALAGWAGAWIDCSVDNISYIKSQGCENKRLIVEQQFVTRDNVVELLNRLTRLLGVTMIDFLSLDVDGNDYHIMSAMLAAAIKPRVVCVEYNAKFRHPLQVVIEYDEKHVWRGDDYYGASLASMVEMFNRYEYTLITCSLSGANAFFVDNKEATRFKQYPPYMLYQPSRYYIQYAPGGHPASLKFLARRYTSG